MKKAVSHVWERLVAFICVLTLTASYLPAMPVFAESKNGYSTSISADESEADVGEKITFKASVSFDKNESTDEEAEDFSYDWYVNGDHKADGDTYELKVDSVDGDSEKYEVYFEAKGKTSGNTLKSDTKTVTFYKLYTVSFEGADVDSVKKRSGKKFELPKPSKNGNRFTGWKDSDKTYDAGDEYTVKGDATLTAQWQETVTITFDADGGKLDDDTITIDKGEGLSASDLPTTSKDHYEFLGWFKDKDKKTKYDGSSFNKDSKLYAGWEQTEFKVTFDANGGNGGPGEIWVAKGTAVPKASLDNKPVYVGRNFKGWKIGDAAYKDQEINEDTVLTANWNLETYKVTFDANGGMINGKSSDELTKEHDSTFGDQLPEPTREDKTEEEGTKKTGYKFSKWVSKSDSSKELKADTEITGPWDVIAEWEETEYYKVTYVCEEGEAKGSLPDDKATEWTEKGKKASCPKPSINNTEGTDVHYAFEGWYTDEARTNKYNEAIEDAATLYAHWIKLYKVSFVTAKGTKKPVYVKEGDSLTREVAVEDLEGTEGYTLVGFFKDADFKEEYKFDNSDGEKISAAIFIYVQWRQNSYNVHYNPKSDDDKGSTEVKGTMNPNPQERKYDDGASLIPNTFTREGYTFAGWKVKGGDTVFEDQDTRNITDQDNVTIELDAQWKPNEYTVRFHSNFVANGETEEKTEDQEGFIFDVSEQLNNNLFFRNGFDYYVWATDKDVKADGCKFFKKEDTVLNLTSEDKATVHLYAIWIDRKEPTIQYRASVKSETDDGKKKETERVVYTITVYDEGSGVNKDAIYYATGAAETEPKDIALDKWKAVPANKIQVEKEDGINKYTFEVGAKAKAAVFIKAEDFGTIESYKPESGNSVVTGIKDSPNIGYEKIHLSVVESNPPEVKIVEVDGNSVSGSDYTSGATKSHTFTFVADDAPEPGDGSNIDAYSGIRKVRYILQKKIGDGQYQNVDNYMNVELVAKEDTPQNQYDIDALKSIRGEDNEINGGSNGNQPQLDGEYRLVVIAEDFCGNTSDTNPETATAKVNLIFDNTAPTITIHADGGNYYDDQYYYNDNTWSGETITIGGVSTEDGVSGLQSYKITAKGSSGSKIWNQDNSTPNNLNLDDAKNLGEGEIQITATATDDAGNKTEVIVAAADKNDINIDTADDISTASMVYDNTAPVLSVEMNGGNKFNDDNEFYYNKDNCGLTLTIGSDNDTSNLFKYTVTVRNTDNDKVITEVLNPKSTESKDSEQKRTIVEQKGKDPEKPVQGKPFVVKFDAEEMQKLGDGHIEVTAVAQDYALNENSKFEDISGLKKEDSAGEKASFLLDMTSPEVTNISSTGTAKGQDNKKPYDESGEHFYYYNDESITTEFTIKEDYPDKWDLSYTFTDGHGNGTDIKKEIDADQAVECTFTDEGRYTSIAVSGKDKAGNPLKLPDGDSSLDTGIDAANASNGNVTLNNGKAIDRKVPNIVLGMKGGNLYDGSFYYNNKEDAINNCNKGKVTIGEDGDVALIKSYIIIASSDGGGNPEKWVFNVPEKEKDLSTAQKVMTVDPMGTINNLNDGTITIEVIAIDRAGNENNIITPNTGEEDFVLSVDKKKASFVLDKSAPALSVEMTGGNKFNDDNEFYYNKDNCGLTLTIGSDNDISNLFKYTVTVRNTDNDKVITEVLNPKSTESKDSEQKRTIVEQKGKDPEKPVQGKPFIVKFDAEEMQKLGDGHISATVVAQDYALNESSSFDAIGGMKKKDSKTATCVLDMTNPVVTNINTDAAEKGLNVNGTANAEPYVEDGGNFYYYNDEKVETQFVIEDVNLNAWTVSYNRDGTSIKEQVISTKVVETGTTPFSETVLTHYFDTNEAKEQKASSEGRYTDISVQGQDKAGNPLVLVADYNYTGKGSNEVDPAEQKIDNKSGDVIITLKNGKVIDRTVPVAELTYNTKATAYLYNGTNAANQDPETVANNYSIATAYINKAFEASVAISDTYDQGANAVDLDFDKLTVRQYGKNPVNLTSDVSDDKYQKDGTLAYAFDIATDKEHATDGAYFYKIFGTDRAGNAMTVKESVSDSVKTERIKLEKFYETKDCASTYDAKLRFILDTVNPTFAFELADPKGDETTDGNTAYYGSGTKTLSGTFSVVDSHIDVDRIGAGYGSFSASDVSKNKKPHYSDMSVGWDKINIEYDLSNDGKGSTFKKVITKDREGVYRFGIAGVDKAGNQVVQSTGEAKKTGYKSTVQVEKDKNGKFWTWHKVLDKTAPTGDLNIGNYYHVSMDSHGNNTLDTKSYNPYRSEKKADVSITSNDLSPIRITYNIDSTVSGQNQKHADKDYANNNEKSTSVSGEQIFHVSDLLLMDRAGNKTGFYQEGKTEANKIYLDKTPPKNHDVDRPQATITASRKVTASSPDGRDLFNRSINLTVHVVDPYENVKSSGLKFAKYEVKADGKTVISKTHDGVTKKADLYKDVKLEHEFKETVNIPKGGSFETNDIEIIVTAEDNAGNVAETVTYKFGIDTVGPEIVVTYDNNSAQNGFYFKENRIATVEATERNLDDGKIKIETQVNKPAFRNVRHSGNGNNDKWQKKLSYTSDGNYTLNISGTDALGNPAKVSYAKQVAPQKFTIDKTAPGVNVTYDNNDVLNEKYYKATRTATISISDVNFAGQNDIRVESRGGGSVPATVSFSGNSATIHFPEDGIYVFNGSVTDQAGNITKLPVQTEFVIDTHVPVLTFENGNPFKVNKASAADLAAGKSDHPVDPQFFTIDVFAPMVTVTDTNISTTEQDAVFNITGTKEGNTYTRTIYVHGDDGTKFDMSMASTLFRVAEEVDDVYKVLAYAIDLAGNKSEEISFTFSINRFGSNFVCATEETKKYIRDKYYHNATEDLDIHEYNTNAIKKDSQTVEVMKDGNTANVRKLVAGKDYDFEEDRAAGSKEGGRIYKYTIHKDVFEEEGDYSFTISSVDEAGHKNTTARIHRDTDQTTGEKKLSVASFPIDFVIDKTPPTNQMTGVKSSRKQTFNDRSLVVDVNPEDAQTGVSKVVIRRWETDTIGFREPNGEPMADITYAYYDQENPIPSSYKDEKTGTEHSFADLSEYTDDTTGKIDINYELTDNQNWQWVEVITTDLADNDSVDIRAGSADSPQIVENRKGFLVTTNTLTQVINNTAARVGTGAAVAALLILLILWKRKKDKNAEGAM